MPARKNVNGQVKDARPQKTGKQSPQDAAFYDHSTDDAVPDKQCVNAHDDDPEIFILCKYIDQRIAQHGDDADDVRYMQQFCR